MSAAPSDAAPSDAAAAAPAPGEKQARLPGLRGHHKLYLAAVALVAVCVWLIVWLVVFGKMLPEDIVGFAAVVFQVTVKTGVFALLFARYVAGAGAVVAPAAPEGKVGTAPGLRAWAHEAFELDAARTRERGGVDAELHVRRIRMRLACLEVWALLAVPLACVYALDPKKCGWLPERREVEEEPCTGANPCCGFTEALADHHGVERDRYGVVIGDDPNSASHFIQGKCKWSWCMSTTAFIPILFFGPC